MNKLLVLTPDAEQYSALLRQHDLGNLEIVTAVNGEKGRHRIADCHLVLGVPALVAQCIDAAAELKWVQSTFAGTEALCAPALRRDYLLTGIKGIFGPYMSEYILGYILALERHFFEVRQNQSDKVWQDISYQSLRGITIGILGLGSIGRHIAKTAAHFGMRVLGLKRSADPVPHVEALYTMARLEKFLMTLDYLVVTLPHTPETNQLINLKTLGKMKSSAIVINVGRGAVINEADLIQALRDQTIRGAVLDVFEHEPLPPTSPLWSMSNVIITPHISAISFPKDIVAIFVDNYRRFVAQKPLKYLVDFDKGY